MAKSTAKSRAARKRAKDKPTLAQRADRHLLYQQSVQEPEVEARFFARTYRQHFGSEARFLREDFCGTFAVCCEWVKRGKDRTALGVDLDPDPLAWGIEHNLAQLPDAAQRRVELLQDDARKQVAPGADVLAAQNFSFWIFKTRAEVREYFAATLGNLARQGILVLDMMGGPECLVENQVDQRRVRGFTYEWEQERFDPITHDCRFHIHFAFRDGSRLDRAFTYDWRMWSIPEVRELLLEAGYDRVVVYWEGADAKGEGNGVYRPRQHAGSDPCWIAYIVGVKDGPKRKA